MEIAEALRARLAAAGIEPPADVRERERMERDLAVHLARVAALAEAAELGAGDRPYTDPTAVATIALPELAAAHNRLLSETGEEGYGPRLLAAIRLGKSALATEYLAGLRYRGRFGALVEEALGGRDALPLAGMTGERQQTALAAASAALLLAKLNNHTLTRDHLSDDEWYMVAISSVTDVTGGDGPAGLVFAAYLLAWVADLVTEATRDDDGHHTPGPAIRHLLSAAQHLLGSYIDAHETPGFELDGTVYRAVSGYAGADEAVLHMRAAAEMIERLLPTTQTAPDRASADMSEQSTDIEVRNQQCQRIEQSHRRRAGWRSAPSRAGATRRGRQDWWLPRWIGRRRPSGFIGTRTATHAASSGAGR